MVNVLAIFIALADEFNGGTLQPLVPLDPSTVKRNSPVVLCANMGSAHRSAAVISALFVFNRRVTHLALLRRQQNTDSYTLRGASDFRQVREGWSDTDGAVLGILSIRMGRSGRREHHARVFC